MKIVVATNSVPFVRGGAEVHADSLCSALRLAGHEVECVSLPFKWYPPEKILDHMLACRLLDLTEANGNKVDLMIGLKFPAYLINHPNKVLWILHQHRQAYEFWGQPLGDMDRFENGAEVRDAIHRADREMIRESKGVYTNSANVANRLKRFCDIDAEPLYHPPFEADAFYCESAEPYLFYPSHLNPRKRQEFVVRALAETREKVCVEFAGPADDSNYCSKLQSLATDLGVAERIRWLGQVAEETKRDRYARCLGVLYPPIDEDFGYVTLESMLASKPVITCTDSGGPLEFVQHRKTGLVVDSNVGRLAEAMDEVWTNRGEAGRWGANGREHYQGLKITWSNVVERLVA